VAHNDEKKYVYKVLMGKHEARSSLVGPRNRQRIILKLIFKEYGQKVTNGFIWLRRGTNRELL